MGQMFDYGGDIFKAIAVFTTRIISVKYHKKSLAVFPVRRRAGTSIQPTVLPPLPEITRLSQQAARDDAIHSELASSNLSLCLALIQQSQDDAARSVRKCLQFIFQVEDAGTLGIMRSSNALLPTALHFKKRSNIKETVYCSRACWLIEKAGLLNGRLFDLPASAWRDALKGSRASMGSGLSVAGEQSMASDFKFLRLEEHTSQ
jgi:hypothetical protein